MTELLQAWIVAKHRELVPPGSLRSRFALGMFWSLAGAVISRGFLLAASVACARFLGKDGFGALGMIQSTAGTFGIFAGLGLGSTAAKYVAEFRRQDPAKTGRILALSASATFIFGSVMTVALILLRSDEWSADRSTRGVRGVQGDRSRQRPLWSCFISADHSRSLARRSAGCPLGLGRSAGRQLGAE